jgi:hypothetical protein
MSRRLPTANVSSHRTGGAVHSHYARPSTDDTNSSSRPHQSVYATGDYAYVYSHPTAYLNPTGTFANGQVKCHYRTGAPFAFTQPSIAQDDHSGHVASFARMPRAHGCATGDTRLATAPDLFDAAGGPSSHVRPDRRGDETFADEQRSCLF